MYVAPGYEETGQSAADHHIFAITDVVDYPIPAQRPPVEVGKLIDDISVKAILTEDISDFVEEPKDKLSDADRLMLACQAARSWPPMSVAASSVRPVRSSLSQCSGSRIVLRVRFASHDRP